MGLNFFASQKIQFRDKDDPQPLIERSGRKKTQLVRTPVHAVHRLVGDLQDWDIIAYFGKIIGRRQGHLKFSKKNCEINSIQPNQIAGSVPIMTELSYFFRPMKDEYTSAL